jgi:ligand-binding sensor domain-containing protein
MLAACILSLTITSANAEVVVIGSTKTVTDVCADLSGNLWVATAGGLFQMEPSGKVHLRSGIKGGPRRRVTGMIASGDGVTVLDGEAFRWNQGRWVPTRIPGIGGGPPAAPTELPEYPRSRAEQGDWQLWVTGFGLWETVNEVTRPVTPPVPTPTLSSVTFWQGEPVVGTGDSGILRLRRGHWEEIYGLPPGLPGPDATALIALGGEIWISPREGPSFTLDARSTGAGAPWRQSVKWDGKWVVRRADGRLLIGANANVLKPFPRKLPRVHATSLAVEGDTLLVAQPGGWSEFRPDGERHEFGIAELAGAPTTAIWADSDRILVGTQNNGFVQVSRSRREVQHIHEGQGMTDDWVTAFAPDGQGGVLIGTFVGGLLRWDRKIVAQVGLKESCITRLISDGDSVWVGSLWGVWRYHKGQVATPEWSNLVERDVYDIALVESELWVAAGGALHRVRGARTMN